MCTFVLAATATVIDYPVNRNNRWNYECCLTIISPETTALYRKRSRVLKTTTAVSTIHDESTNQSDQIEILLYLEKDRKCGTVIYCSFNSKVLEQLLADGLVLQLHPLLPQARIPNLGVDDAGHGVVELEEGALEGEGQLFLRPQHRLPEVAVPLALLLQVLLRVVLFILLLSFSSARIHRRGGWERRSLLQEG
jgi:hypothetical protein